jgi:hypothetical protein
MRVPRTTVSRKKRRYARRVSSGAKKMNDNFSEKFLYQIIVLRRSESALRQSRGKDLQANPCRAG